MPNTMTYSKLIPTWETLLAAVTDNAIANAEPFRSDLEQHLTEARALKARQSSARGQRQRLTQEIQQKLVTGEETAMRLRGVVKSQLGPKNERLVQFGIAPLRRRPSKPATEPGEPESPPPVITQKAAGDASNANARGPS